MIAVILFLDSLGGGEVMVIMLFILIFFGADKIPGLAKGLGKGMREFKDAMNGIQSELKQNMADAENQINKVKESLPEIKLPDLSEPFKAAAPVTEPVQPSTEKTPEAAKEVEKPTPTPPPAAPL